MSKFMREVKFRSAGSKLRVYAHEGKTGFNVGASVKNPGMKALTGCQETFETADAAENRFKARIEEALAAGWVPREVGEGGARKIAFTSIPTAPAAPAPSRSEEKVIGGDVVDKDGFIIDPKAEAAVLETVPAGASEAKPVVKNGSARHSARR